MSADEIELRELLLDAEQRAASVPGLELRIDELERLLADARQDTQAAQRATRELDARLMQSAQTLSDVMRSPSWQMTEPLRRAKRRLR